MFIMVAPWLLSGGIDLVMGTDAFLDAGGPFGMFAVFIVTGAVAVGVALLCLVIAVIVQFWRHHRPFAAWWPVVLSFPVTWGLLLPEMLVRNGPASYWLLLGAAIAAVFSVHWLALNYARMVLDD